MGLTGKVQGDRGAFLTQARVLRRRRNRRFFRSVVRFRLAEANRDESISLLDALEDQEVARNRVEGSAKGATDARDAAYRALFAWMSQAHAVAKVALRGRPDLLNKLDLK